MMNVGGGLGYEEHREGDAEGYHRVLHLSGYGDVHAVRSPRLM